MEWLVRPNLNDPVLIAAFEGWNDAGDAASEALDHLLDVSNATLCAELDPDDYYDFQVNRPIITIQDGQRDLEWRTTRMYFGRIDDRDLLIVRGLEPNLRWREFCQELLGIVDLYDVALVVQLAALLADVPHTRDVPLTALTSHPSLVEGLAVEASRYEGPTGIVGVIHTLVADAEIASVSLWAAVPHYVSQAPCPKAALALVECLAELIDARIPLGDLPEEAQAWQSAVDEVTSDDEDIESYVRQLEKARDSERLSQVSGEDIAAAFERYLRRKT